MILVIGTVVSCVRDRGQKESTSEAEMIKGELIIFHAGSLSVPFKEIIKEFCAEYPDVEVLPESSGNIENTLQISDLKKAETLLGSNLIDKQRERRCFRV
ncbi:MAG: hypothetical protein V1904_05485 [Bacteroidota bacterium]